MTEEFLMRLDQGMLEWFRDMATQMVDRFGISRAEAVARINSAYGDIEFAPYPDLICHDLPEHWAHGLYYEDPYVPYWEPDADPSIWGVRPAPPKDSPAWTLREE